MNLNAPKKNTFLTAVVFAAAGWLVYVLHLITLYIFHHYQLHLQMISCVLVSIAFVVLSWGIITKNA